jgi:transglutaminase-like putative cysteine protease
MMRRCTILAAAAAGLWLATPASAADEVVHDIWFAQFHGETKSGWSHERRVRSERDGKNVVVTESESKVLRGPGGVELKTPIRSSSRFVEDENGAVLSYATSVDIGFGPQIREGTVKDGVISAKEDGKARTLPYPEGALGPAGVDRAIAAELKADVTGKAVEFAAIDPASSAPVTWTVHGTTTAADILGRYVWLFRVVKKDRTGLPETLLIDGAGRHWGGDLNLGTIRYFRTEEVVAKADREPASWLTSRVIAPSRAIPASAHRARIVLRLTRKDGAVGDLPESASQKIVARGESGSIDVELTEGKPTSDLVLWMRPYIGDDVDAAYLAETPIVELSNPRLKRLAKEAVGRVEDALGSARAVERTVKQGIHPAPANVGFASACEAISSRTGDSTESAVLTVGFARSLGLPARLVSGFVYWGPELWPEGRQPRGAFAPHLWAEVYVGEDLWWPVDPMRLDLNPPPRSFLQHGGFDVTHVAVLRSDAATTTPFTDIVVPVLEFMDGLEIEVLEPKE